MVISLKSTESWSSRSNRSKTPVHTVQPVHGPITERPALGYSVQPVHWTGSPAGCILHWPGPTRLVSLYEARDFTF